MAAAALACLYGIVGMSLSSTSGRDSHLEASRRRGVEAARVFGALKLLARKFRGKERKKIASTAVGCGC